MFSFCWEKIYSLPTILIHTPRPELWPHHGGVLQHPSVFMTLYLCDPVELHKKLDIYEHLRIPYVVFLKVSEHNKLSKSNFQARLISETVFRKTVYTLSQETLYAKTLMVENPSAFFSEKTFFHEIKKFIEPCHLAFQKAQKQIPTRKIRKVRSKKPRGEQ